MPIILNPFPYIFGVKSSNSTNTTSNNSGFFSNQFLFSRLPSSKTENFAHNISRGNNDSVEHKSDGLVNKKFSSKSPSKFVGTSQGFKDILWEQAGSIYERPILTQLQISKEMEASDGADEAHADLPLDGVTTLWEQEYCAICLEEFVSGQEMRTLSCRHFFHSRCINEWFLSSSASSMWKSNENFCPVCKASSDSRFEKTSNVEVKQKIPAEASPSKTANIPTISFLRAGENLVSASKDVSLKVDTPKTIFFRNGRVHSSKQQEMQKNGLAMLFMLAAVTDEDDISVDAGSRLANQQQLRR